ncbi:unnamed protein product, partial [Rotaria magnacalcarata]
TSPSSSSTKPHGYYRAVNSSYRNHYGQRQPNNYSYHGPTTYSEQQTVYRRNQS